MSRKVKRVRVSLDPLRVDLLPEEEIRVILRGADDLILTGGRTLLAKILKGSREKKILELGLNKSPVYGAFRRFTLQEITARIDWLIVNGYLDIEYDYRLPLLVYTRRGWAIERETYADELMGHINEWLADPTTTRGSGWLNDKNREVLFLLLDRLEDSQDPKYVPVLEAWASNTSRKLARRIHGVCRVLRHQ
jgi:superfamily II DNA helicase RecQ